MHLQPQLVELILTCSMRVLPIGGDGGASMSSGDLVFFPMNQTYVLFVAYKYYELMEVNKGDSVNIIVLAWCKV